MPSEDQNPARRYKWFRPRMGAHSFYSPAAPTNKASHYLYNNSTGPRNIVVRDVRISSTVSVVGILIQGFTGSNLGNVQACVAGEAIPIGQHYYADINSTPATLATFSFPVLATLTAWSPTLPIAVLPPGWSLLVQALNSATAISVCFIWEAIYPEELDYMW